MTLRFWLILNVVLLIASLCAGCEGNSEGSDTVVSLIIAVVDDTDLDPGDSDTRCQHLIKYQFANGELISTDTFVTNPGQQLRFNCQESRLYQNRYVITDFGDIVDITTEEFLHRGGSGSGFTRLKGTEDNRVIIYIPQSDAYHYYDLATKEYAPLAALTKWALPGVLSPDQTKSASAEFGRFECSEIWLYTLDGNRQMLGSGFCLQLSPLSGSIIGVPLMWLDDERILTQKSNGAIVILKMDGTVIPVVTIDEAKGDSPFTEMMAGAMGAEFSKNEDGNITYTIHFPWHPKQEPGADKKAFLIDVEAREYSPYSTDWIDLEHGFEAAYLPQSNRDRSIRYHGRDIGREFFSPFICETTEGYIALAYHDEAAADSHSGIKIWSSLNEQWTVIEYEHPIWLPHNGIIGWLE